jgi:hypothetical protein
MAISGADATTIATYLKLHGGATAGANDTATVALYIRDHWGGTGTDANVIALYGESSRDTDLVGWAARLRLHHGGLEPEWLPEGAVAFLDFKNGRYWFGGAEHTRQESIEENLDWGAFDPSKIVGGIGIRATGASSANCAFVLTSGAAAGLLPAGGGLTFVAEFFNAISGTTGQTGCTVEVLDLPNFNVEWTCTLVTNANGSKAYAIGSTTGATLGEPPNGDHKVAVTMAPNHIVGSLDGEDVEAVGTVANNSGATHIAVNVSIFVPDATATSILETLTFYPPQPDESLPALSAN